MKLTPKCPAATLHYGEGHDALVVCGAAANEAERHAGEVNGKEPEPVFKIGTDGTVVLNFCCGNGIPRVDPTVRKPGQDVAAHYTSCPIWQGEKRRIWEERHFMATRKPKPSTTPDFGEDQTEIDRLLAGAR